MPESKSNKRPEENGSVLQFYERYRSFIEKFDISNIIERHKSPIVLFLIGTIFLGVGLLGNKEYLSLDKTNIQVIEGANGKGYEEEVVVEIAGAVEKAGVFRLPGNARVEDVLIASGGLSVDADRDWVEKYVNRAEKLVDGAKIYIPKESEQSKNTSISKDERDNETVEEGVNQGAVNINTASSSELESLWGIGPVYAQKVIEHRPYSSVEDLLTRSVIKKNVYEKNKDKLTVY